MTVYAAWACCVLLPLIFSSAWANVCNETCQLPDCACASIDVPEDLRVEDVPQMVIVTFEGRLTEAIEKLLRRLFPDERVNPNKCPTVSTFYVTNENTDYCAVNRLWAEGHEIGVSGLTRHNLDFWQVATADQWLEEVTRQVENLEEKAGISRYALEGWRTPGLQPGGDTQYYTINDDFYFLYDSTLTVPVLRPGDNMSTYWPFTLDIPYRDAIGLCERWPCPEQRHPGIWELPVTPLWDGQDKRPCTHLNACPTVSRRPEEAYNLLHNNFNRHFSTNRAPFVINVAPRFLLENKQADKALENFLADMAQREEVWIISAAQAIKWSQRPRTRGQLDPFLPWGCIDRRYKRGCEPTTGRNSSLKLFPGLIRDGSSLLLWQYFVLTLVLIILLRYDRTRK